MAEIRFQVYWSTSGSAIFEVDDELSINTIKRNIIDTMKLAEQNDDGDEIEYTLYRKSSGDYEPIIHERRPLNRVGIKADEHLYLADRKAPWWHGENTKRLGRQPQRERQLGGDVIQAGAPTLGCRLYLARRCAVDVAPDKGLILDRDYLLGHLPMLTVWLERSINFFNSNARLSRVSRKRHCEIFFEYSQWHLYVFEPTFVYGRVRDRREIMIIQTSTTIVLGHEGWPVGIQLYTAGQ